MFEFIRLTSIFIPIDNNKNPPTNIATILIYNPINKKKLLQVSINLGHKSGDVNAYINFLLIVHRMLLKS